MSEGGAGIGRILLIEFREEDSAAFNEVMSVLKRYPDFENINLSDETIISIPGLTIYPEQRKTNYIAAKVDEAVCRIMRQVFANMTGAPEEEKYKEILKKQQAAHNAGRRKVSLELDKNRKQLEVLQEEIGKTLLGDSLYTPEDLKEAINTIKARIAEGEEQLQKLDEELLQKNEMAEAALPAYRRFKSWAEEFDTASKEQKKISIVNEFSLSYLRKM